MTLTSNLDGIVSEKRSVHSNDFGPEWIQNWYDGLGYCKILLLL